MIRLFKLAVRYVFESNLPDSKVKDESERIGRYLKFVSSHKEDDLD